MKDIVLWDARNLAAPPIDISVEDAFASACVRAGIAAANSPAEAGALSAGPQLDPSGFIDVVIPAGPFREVESVAVPAVVAGLAISLGIAAAAKGAPPPRLDNWVTTDSGGDIITTDDLSDIVTI